MESINERELGIMGERYGSFLEAYRVNDRRSLNAQVAARGDGSSQGLVEADAGIVFAPEETRRALLYGSDLYAGRYKEMRKRVQRTLLERYEWMDESRFGADVRGEHVIMERYAIGHPEAFHRKRHTVRRERNVAILYDAMCPASTPVAKRIEAGCIVAACADALEHMGYEVAIDFCLATYDGNSMSDDPTLLLEVALKDYGDALNVRRLEFPLAAKPVLFHLGVWWAHRFPSAPSDFGAGEGYPLSYDARRVKAMEEHARMRHGAYLSEDILEVQLGMDPTRALERILGTIGEAGALEQHMVQKTTMQASVSPAQGKLFGGVRVPEAAPDARQAPGEGGTERAEGSQARPGDAGDGEARVDGGADAGGAGGTGDDGAGDAGSEPGNGPGDKPGDDGSRAHGQTGRSGDEGTDGSGEDGKRARRETDRGVPEQDSLASDADAGAGAGSGDGGQALGGSHAGGDAGCDADDATSAADGSEASAGGSADGGEDGADELAGAGDGSATSGSSDGAAVPSGAGDADSPGGGSSGEERPRDDEDDSEDDSEDDEREEDDGEQERTMDDDIDERREPERSDDADQSEGQPPEDQRSKFETDADEEERERDSFIVELRKRYVRFERGDYRRMKEREMREAQADAGSVNAASASGAAGRGPVKAPPAVPVTGADDYEFGTPRSTPFSMNYVPKRKG